MAPLCWHDFDTMEKCTPRQYRYKIITKSIYAKLECATEEKSNFALTEVWEDCLCAQNQVKHRFMAQEIQASVCLCVCVCALMPTRTRTGKVCICAYAYACIKLYIYMNIKKLNGNSNSIYIIDFITMAFSSNK
jgi:hypothetical protein